VREVFSSHELFISEQILGELRRVLKSKFSVDQDLIDDFILLLEQECVSVQPVRLPGVELQDKDDIPILGAALASGSEVLVTGDKELLDLGRMKDVEILSPRQFWERLKTAIGT